MDDFREMTLSTKQRMQLAEEEMWMNPEDEWLDYNSSSEEETQANPDHDALHYDEKADDSNAKWVEDHLSKYLPNTHSDAVLNCPSCFALLCLHCQRHDTYLTQYRAMFVRNCKVYKEKELRYRKQQPQLSKTQQRKLKFQAMKEARKQKRTQEDGSIPEVPQQTQKPFEYLDNILVEEEGNFETTVYWPVHCALCDVEIAVMDQDEVYHFYNVVPSD